MLARRLFSRAPVASLQQYRTVYKAEVRQRLGLTLRDRKKSRLDDNSPNVGVGTFGSAACGDFSKNSLEYNPEQRVITKADALVYGCGSAVASGSYVSEAVRGKTLDEVVELDNRTIASALSLPPVKLHCSLLAEGALQAAVKNLVEKQPELKDHLSEKSRKKLFGDEEEQQQQASA